MGAKKPRALDFIIADTDLVQVMFREQVQDFPALDRGSEIEAQRDWRRLRRGAAIAQGCAITLRIACFLA
jgi:hypothetical protein